MENLTLDMSKLSVEEREQVMKWYNKSLKKLYPINPKENDVYWTITNYGNVIKLIYNGSPDDHYRLKTRNYFLTEEAAFFSKEKHICSTELQDFADRYNEILPDWSTNDIKYIITYYHKRNIVSYNSTATIQYPNTIYFTPAEICENAILTIGADRIKKYLFDITE